MNSSRVYTAVTNHWPKIATGLVVAVGIAEFVAGGLSVDSSLELYLLSWGGITSGLWFLFDIAEKSLSDTSRQQLREIFKFDAGSALKSLPSSFASLFDYIFGDNHWTPKCLAASTLFSFVGVLVITSLALSLDLLNINAFGSLMEWLPAFLLIFVTGIAYNVIPDYVSLLETRWLVGKVQATKNLVLVLLLDLVLSFVLFIVWVWLLFVVPPLLLDITNPPVLTLEWVLGMMTFTGTDTGKGNSFTTGGVFGIFFYSTFITSIWLWLYAIAVLISRVLLKMNSGLGHVLKATDVETQPFRSLGFVSVLLVSILFLLGLPFVIW